MRVRLVKPLVGVEELEEVRRVLESGHLAYGPTARRFEEEFARFTGARFAVAVSSGTAALEVALRAAGVGEGDEVIVPCFTFIATANAVLRVGAKPVFADVEEDTLCIDPESVMEKLTPRTRAVIAVHLYGHPADVVALREIAEDHKLVLIEDAAQAHGASTPLGVVGSIGDAAAFSFYATKNMTTGEGGMVTTNSELVAHRARLLVNHGQEGKYNHITFGWNYRMSDLQAAVGLAQLRKLPAMNEARRRNAALLTEGLKGLPLELPVEKPGYRHVYHQYVVRVRSDSPVTRDELAARLAEAGVETAIHYPRTVVDQPLYRALGYAPGRLTCPVAADAASRVLSLPVGPHLSRREIEYVIEAVRRALS